MQKRKQLVFIENGSSEMLAKIAFVLRKKGYETVLISTVGNLETPLLMDSYDKRISFNLKYFKLNFKNLPRISIFLLKKIKVIKKSLLQMIKLKPHVIMARANPNWMCVLSKFFFWRYPFVYFPYDMRSSGFSSIREANSVGIPTFEMKAEKYCFEHANGIMHKGAEDELENLNKKVLGNIKIKCPTIYFFPYCLEEFIVDTKNKKIPNKKNEIHIVFPGSMGIDWFWVVEAMVNQKLHFHLYAKTAYLSEAEEYPKIKKAFKKILGSKYFHLHDRVDQKEITKEISKYDFGIFSLDILSKGNKYSTGNKISSFIEAGIPLLNASSHEAAANLIDKYGIGFNFDEESLKYLKDILKRKNYRKLVKNVIRAREELCIRKHIPRLEKFFEEVIENKKGKSYGQK